MKRTQMDSTLENKKRKCGEIVVSRITISSRVRRDRRW